MSDASTGWQRASRLGSTPPDEVVGLALWGTPADGTVAEASLRPARRSLREVINALGLALLDASPLEAARLRHRIGYLALASGDVRGKANEAFSLMRTDAIKAGDRRLEALAECGLAAVHDFLGERRESIKHARKAKRLAGKLGDKRILAVALNAEAQFYKENGENPRAFKMFEQIAEIGRELDDRQFVMGAHIGMGRTTPMDRPAVGIRHYEQAIELAEAAGDEATLALALNNLSDWRIYTGEYEEALRLRDESLRLSLTLGLRPDIGRSLIGQAKIHTIMGKLEEARELLDKGFPAVVSTGDLEGDLHSQLNLAHLYVRTGDVPRAVELYRVTLERSLAAPDHACAVFAQRALDLLTEGELPKPGILPDEPVRELEEDAGMHDLALAQRDLLAVVGGAAGSYPTGDRAWYPS